MYVCVGRSMIHLMLNKDLIASKNHCQICIFKIKNTFWVKILGFDALAADVQYNIAGPAGPGLTFYSLVGHR